jgi:negative regulator of sigma E activity
MTDPRPSGPSTGVDGFRDRTDERIARSAGEQLRASADDLDATTRSRLNQARQRALAEVAAPIWQRAGWPAAATAVGVAAGVAAVAVVVLRDAPPGTEAPAPVAAALPAEAPADLELLLAPADEELEMVEDLEFYAFLDADRSADELQAELDGIG